MGVRHFSTLAAMKDEILDYCSSQAGLLLVPVEVLSDQGLDAEAARAFQQRNLLSVPECERIDQMVFKYCQRADKLGRASPQWFPARIQHLCLVSNGAQTRPYFQPFHASSWLLYRDDIQPSTSSLEFSIFMLLQAERQYLQQQIGGSLMANLPYLLILNETQRDDFCAGCYASTRPDGAAYRALADAMPAICGLHHDPFRRPSAIPAEYQLLNNGMIVNAEQREALARLQSEWIAAVESVIQSHHSSTAQPDQGAGQSILQWLESEAPELVLTGQAHAVLWQGPSTSDDRLTRLFSSLTPEAERSILEDLKVVDRKSRLFLDSLTNADRLKPPAPWMTESGLSFIHAETNRIAYSLTDDPERLRQPSPPYERLMLAARTIHEWGHQAAETGWVRVAPERQHERNRYEQELIEMLDCIIGALPGPLQPVLLQALNIQDSAVTPGQHLLNGLLRRIDDYMANVLARRYLTADEMDTYVRNNVGSRMPDYAPEQALQHLLRVAYEYQYLHLSSIEQPMDWFLKSTWFEPLFVHPGLITLSSFVDLTDQIGKICSCYAIDPAAIELPVL